MTTQRTQLLEFVGTVVIPATTEPFVARDRFVQGFEGAVGISSVSGSFEKHFCEKIEDPAAATMLRYSRTLLELGSDDAIIKELGGKAETRLAQVYRLMQRQDRGGRGPLLIEGANLFFVQDVNHKLCALYVYRQKKNWRNAVYPALDWSGWAVNTNLWYRALSPNRRVFCSG